MKQWINVKVSYTTTNENGNEKDVTEEYLVSAIAFKEAEEKAVKEVEDYVTGEINMQVVKRAKFREVLSMDNADDTCKWYKAKLMFNNYNEKTDTSKLSPVNYLVQGVSVKDVVNRIEKFMGGSVFDYSIDGVNKTNIVSVILNK